MKLTPSNAAALKAVRTILRYIGEDPDREGLQDTPRRVLGAMMEATAGSRMRDPDAPLARVFTSNYDGIVVVPGIEFASTCEHHLLPFIGEALIAYQPKDGVIVGLSKLPRIVENYARRLQTQEVMTTQIAKAIQTTLKPHGVGVIIQSKHLCMVCRGVRQNNPTMITSELLGTFRTNPSLRAELFSLHTSSRKG